MKILYGAGNWSGSNVALSRFVENAKDHEIKTLAFYQNHQHLKSIDWCLDALYDTRVGERNYFKKYHGVSGPHIKHQLADMVIDDLVGWGPELVISDCEFFSAMVAQALELPLWYCSPILQLTGIEHDRKAINSKQFDKTKNYIQSLPQGSKYLVYSSLCDVSSRPLLKSGFEWVQPYPMVPKITTTESIDFEVVKKAIPKRSYWTSGEMSFATDCLYTNKPFYISPNPSDIEQQLNAQLFEWYGVARNIGRPESLSFAFRQIERGVLKPTLSIQNWKQLDQRINESSI